MIKLSDKHNQRLVEEAFARLPNEACGLLLGVKGQGFVNITDIVFSNNVSEGDCTRSFEIDPALYIKLQKRSRSGGADIIGVWYSHPYGMPEPSRVDKARSLEKDWVWLISAVCETTITTKGYLSGSDTPSVFKEIEISVEG